MDCNDITLKKPGTVTGYFGKEGSYTESAARSMYGGIFKSYSSIQGLFAAVAQGEIDYGVVPIENSVEGSVGITNDLLYHDHLSIVAETYSRISHALIVKPGTTLDEIEGVISHPQALGQCSSILLKLGVKTVPFPDTATAVSALSESQYSRYAAIGSEKSAALYGMEILQHDVGDFHDNYTRFVSVAKEMASDRSTSGKNKASIVVSLDHRPGSLKEILEIFSDHNINLTRIESRPVKFSPWRYIFFLDCVLTEDSEKAFSEVEKKSSSFKLLGIYPMSEL